MSKRKPIPAFVAIYRSKRFRKAHTERLKRPPFGENANKEGDEPRSEEARWLNVQDVALDPALQQLAVNRRELRSALREMVKLGFPVVT
jgi:hypothetical protein